ncbi:MAG: hypothetical protein P1U67_08260 [Alcanivoracaceae bacterium]|nr:hypothetical protein [Alcanivoracaceae bacterium]
MDSLSIGDKVKLVTAFPGMHPTLKQHMQDGHIARILRTSVTDGPTRYLVKFDQTDAMYGLHWLAPAVLESAG